MSIIYGWLWLVMAGYEVLFGFRYQIQAACRRPVMRRHITKLCNEPDVVGSYFLEGANLLLV